MSSEVQRLKDRLFPPGQPGAVNVKWFPGSNPDATAEEIAGAMNRALDNLTVGDFETVENFDD